MAPGRANRPRQIQQSWSAAIAVASVIAVTTGCGTLHVRPPTRIDDPVRVYNEPRDMHFVKLGESYWPSQSEQHRDEVLVAITRLPCPGLDTHCRV